MGLESESVQELRKGPSRHEELYFEGDPVVLALGTQPILLRVFRSTLSSHSDVFRDMFSLPSNAEIGAEGTTDENPIFLPDDPEAFVYVLKLYHYSVVKPSITPPDFATAIGALRVASKYQFQDAQKWCIEFFQNSWSLKSSIWLSYLSNPTPKLAQDALDLIGVSRETGLTEFLSPSFYFLCVFGKIDCTPSNCTILSHCDLSALLKGSRRLAQRWGTWCYNECGQNRGKEINYKGILYYPERQLLDEASLWKLLVEDEGVIGDVISAMGLRT